MTNFMDLYTEDGEIHFSNTLDCVPETEHIKEIENKTGKKAYKSLPFLIKNPLVFLGEVKQTTAHGGFTNGSACGGGWYTSLKGENLLFEEYGWNMSERTKTIATYLNTNRDGLICLCERTYLGSFQNLTIWSDFVAEKMEVIRTSRSFSGKDLLKILSAKEAEEILKASNEAFRIMRRVLFELK